MPTDLPPGLIPVPTKGAVSLLTAAEFVAAVKRGKWWHRRVAMLTREQARKNNERRGNPRRSSCVSASA